MGDLTADIYMPQKDIRLGGAALNGAIWARNQHAIATIVSAIGTDKAGTQFSQKLEGQHLPAYGIQKKRGKTSSIEIFVSDSGERRYGVWNPGVLKTYHLRKKDSEILTSQDAVVVTVYPQYEHILRELAVWKQSLKDRIHPLVVINYGDLKEFGNSLDVVIRHITLSDVMVFGLDKDLDEERINALRILASIRQKMVIVTLGKYGSIVWNGKSSYLQSAKDVHVVDTTGAGDSFLAGFLVSYLATKDIPHALQKGTDLASQVIRRVGAY